MVARERFSTRERPKGTGRHRFRRALHRRGGDLLQARLCARLRGHRVEAPGISLSVRSGGLLAEGQKPGGGRCDARGRGGVEL